MLTTRFPPKAAEKSNRPHSMATSATTAAHDDEADDDGAATASTGTSTLMADLGWSSSSAASSASGGTSSSTLSERTLLAGDSQPSRHLHQQHRAPSSNASSTLPWSEDAVAENRRLWQHIEAMLYGEQELPDDADSPALRRELLQWRRHFPHLRIRGTAPRMSGVMMWSAEQRRRGANNSTAAGDVEEVLAIHPAPPAPLHQHNASASGVEVLSRRHNLSRTAISLPAQLPSSLAASADVGRMLEHCLRISSSSWSRRPTTTMLTHARQRQQRTQQQKPVNLLCKRTAVDDDADDYDDDDIGEPRINSVRSEIQRVHYDDYAGPAHRRSRLGGVGELPAVADASDHQHLPATLSSAVYRRLQPNAASSLLYVDGSRIGTARTTVHMHSSKVGGGGQAAIRRRTILPPINAGAVDDRGGGQTSTAVRAKVAHPSNQRLMRSMVRRQDEDDDDEPMTARTATTTTTMTTRTTGPTMGDLFGRSVSAVYVPPLNL